MDDATALLRAAAGGDHAAFAAFVRATQRDVWRFCAHLVDVDTADDLTQDVYLRVTRSMHRFRGDAPARAWLVTIARRTCADHLRTVIRRRDREVTAPVESLATRRAPGDHDGSAAAGVMDIDDALRALPDDQREALVLTRILGLPYAEAAQVVGVPIGTIRSRVSRARTRMAELLEGSQPGSTADTSTSPDAGGHQRRSAPRPW